MGHGPSNCSFWGEKKDDRRTFVVSWFLSWELWLIPSGNLWLLWKMAHWVQWFTQLRVKIVIFQIFDLWLAFHKALPIFFDRSEASNDGTTKGQSPLLLPVTYRHAVAWIWSSLTTNHSKISWASFGHPHQLSVKNMAKSWLIPFQKGSYIGKIIL